MPFLNAGHQPWNWSDVYQLGEQLPWARVVQKPDPGERNYAASFYSDGQLAGAYCLCGADHDSTQHPVRVKVTFWAADLADEKKKPRSLEIIRQVQYMPQRTNLTSRT